MRKIHIPVQVIPAHTIYRCEDCKYFENYGAGDYHACRNWDRQETELHRNGEEIPDDCPLLSLDETNG